MTNKFDTVPVDEEGTTIFQQVGRLGEYDVLYEKWSWNGIMAESLIFANEDIAGLDEEHITNEVKLSPLVNKDSKFTFERSDSGFTFVNFNFQVD